MGAKGTRPFLQMQAFPVRIPGLMQIKQQGLA